MAAVGNAKGWRPPIPPGPYLVLGLARAGRAAAQTLSRLFGADAVQAWDDASAARHSSPARLGIRAQHARRDLLAGVRTLVKSPGVKPDHPLIVQARERGLTVIDELELGWRLAPHPTIAVTGTNGKSTTAKLIAAALRADGQGAALAGNVESVQGGGPLSLLSPEHRGWIVAEVSSYQATGLDRMLPDVAVFTNLTPDHLLWHGSMEAYGQAKRRVFVDGSRAVPLAVVNSDDRFGRALTDDVRARGGRVLTYGADADADYRVQACDWSSAGARISLKTPTGALELRTLLPGAHNAANVAAALAAADGIGLQREHAVAAIAATPAPPGRLERVQGGQSFDVFVDFAHSIDSIVCVLATLRALTRARAGRLIAVLGLPQGARHTRRDCGRAARAGCDHLILDGCSLRGEPPLVTLAYLLEGAREASGATLEIALQRRNAIARALSLARPGDAIAILGRGALQTIAWDAHAQRVPFDDRQVALELLLNPAERERAARRGVRAAVP